MRAKGWFQSLLPVLAIAAWGAACGSGSQSTIDPNAAVSPTYSSISSVLLNPGCLPCHGGAGGYSFDSYANTMQAVVAGNPSASKLYTQMADGYMPAKGTHPSATQIQAVADWITAGAQNN